MPLPFSGNTTSSATSEADVPLPMLATYFSLVPKGGSAVVNVYKITSGGNFCVAPNSLSISAGEMYEGTGSILLQPSEQLMVQVSGSVDYDFTINNLEAP